MFVAEKNEYENLRKDHAALLHDLEEAIEWVEEMVMQYLVEYDGAGIYSYSPKSERIGRGVLTYLADIGRMTTEDGVYYRFTVDGAKHQRREAEAQREARRFLVANGHE